MTHTLTKSLRVTKLTLSYRATRLVISFRRFRTKKSNRSKANGQVVIPLYKLPYKEIVISKRRIGRQTRRQGLARGLFAQPSVPLMIVGIIGVTYFSLHLKSSPDLKLVSSKPAASVAVKKESEHMSSSVPTRIRIASIDLDAPMQAVSLKSDGSLSVPSDPYVTGWYQGSPTPGEIGPSVIDGHVDRIGGIAVFWRLRELKPGDIIEVDRANGSTARFVVDSLEQFSQDNFPTQKVYGNIEYAGIRLITCGGVFNIATRHYSDNTVVFGHLSGK